MVKVAMHGATPHGVLRFGNLYVCEDDAWPGLTMLAVARLAWGVKMPILAK